MASILTQRSTSSMIIKAPTLGRLSFNLFRNISSSAPIDSSASLEGEAATKKPKRKRPKNLIEVAQFLPNWGIGYHMAKKHWKNVSYEITKINLYKDGRHGKAWGLAYKDGLPAEAAKKISGVHKRCWKYIPNPIKATVEENNNPKPEEVQAA